MQLSLDIILPLHGLHVHILTSILGHKNASHTADCELTTGGFPRPCSLRSHCHVARAGDREMIEVGDIFFIRICIAERDPDRIEAKSFGQPIDSIAWLYVGHFVATSLYPGPLG